MVHAKIRNRETTGRPREDDGGAGSVAAMVQRGAREDQDRATAAICAARRDYQTKESELITNMRRTITSFDMERYIQRILDAFYDRWGKEWCDGCDKAMPLVPGTRRCADCIEERG